MLGLNAPSCLILPSVNSKGDVFLQVYQNKHQNLHMYIYIYIFRCRYRDMDGWQFQQHCYQREKSTNIQYPDTRGLIDSSLVENHTEECPPKASVPRLSRQTLHPVGREQLQSTGGADGSPFSSHVKPQCSTREGVVHPSIQLVSPQWSPQVCDWSMGWRAATSTSLQIPSWDWKIWFKPLLMSYYLWITDRVDYNSLTRLQRSCYSLLCQ